MTVVVVVGAATGAVVVVAGAGAGGTVVAVVAPCVDVSAVPAVLAFVATGAVVVVDRVGDPDRDEPPEPPASAPPREPCASLDCVLAIPCAPAPRATRFGLPAVATSSAIRARDTARMTHQLGRPRATLGRRPPEDPVP